MSDTEEHDAQIRREAIADERAKTLAFLGAANAPGYTSEALAAIERGLHLKTPKRYASAPTFAPEAGCAKLRVNGAHARCGA